MSLNLKAIYLALQTVPFAALAVVLPYTVYGYLRTKSVDVWRCTYFYSFVLYFLCAYFMTILPLPSRESFQNMRPISELIQLVPFANFFSIERETIVRDIAVLVFNVVLTVPLGFYLRTLYGFNLKKTVLAGFCVAMFYEVSQLTGLFFIYPRPWRIFDVDDLMINTLGAVVGYVLTPLAARFLPHQAMQNTLRLSRGSEVSFRQRFLSGVIDLCVVLGISAMLSAAAATLMRGSIDMHRSAVYLAAFALVMLVAAAYSLVFGANTPGNRLTGLHLTNTAGQRASRLQSTCRMVLEHICVTAIPFWVYFSMRMSADSVSMKSVMWLAFSTVLMLCAARNVLEMMFNAVTHGSSMFYDRAAKTYLSYSGKKSVFGIRLLEILPLTKANVDSLSKTVCDTLSDAGFGRESVTKVRLMTEGVMLDWMNAGLGNTPCELRLDKHFRKKALILSVPVAQTSPAAEVAEESYVDMFSKMTLKVESYCAAEKNICIIHIP